MSTIKAALWNPIVAKELRSRMRSWRVVAVLVGYLVLVGIVGYAAYIHSVETATDVQSLGQAGRTVFDAVTGAVAVLVAVLVPGVVGSSISGERERQTLDLLLCTPVRPFRIIVGKLVSSLAFVFLLLIASVPIFSAVFLVGGVDLSEVLVVTAVAVVTAGTLGSVAMLCSVLMRRAASATVTSYVAVLLIMLLPVLLGVLETSAASNSQSPFPNGAALSNNAIVPATIGGSHTPIIEMFSPAVGLVSNLAARNNDNSFCAGPGCPPFPKQLPSDEVASGLFRGWREWQVFVLFDLLLSCVLLAVSVKLLGRDPPLLSRLRRRPELTES
jgi:ABC-type transport system involved in multi-copper enzyme maturation permease subunit